MDKSHWKKLENLFLGANIQQMYPGISIQISANEACITWPVESGHFHGGNALHGAAYFKLLDDAAYFAAASIHTTSFLVTGMYSIKFIKPVYSGVITAKGVLAEPSGNQADCLMNLVSCSPKGLASLFQLLPCGPV